MFARGVGYIDQLGIPKLGLHSTFPPPSSLRRKFNFSHCISLSVPNTHFTPIQLHSIKLPTNRHHQTRTSKCASPSCLCSPQRSSFPKHPLSPWTPSPPMTATKGSTVGVGTGKLLCSGAMATLSGVNACSRAISISHAFRIPRVEAFTFWIWLEERSFRIGV